jgi:hypothetical protein
VPHTLLLEVPLKFRDLFGFHLRGRSTPARADGIVPREVGWMCC